MFSTAPGSERAADLLRQIVQAQETEERVRWHIKRGNFRYAIGIMKRWFARAPEDVEILRGLKVFLQEQRVKIRADRAENSRAYRLRHRQKRIAADTRSCAVCGGSMAHTRSGAVVCSVRCRVKKHRAGNRV